MAQPKYRQLVALLALFAAPTSALAWHDGGHATIALIAYRLQTPDGRARLDAILAAHPRYKEDLLLGCPDEANKAEYAFSRAAVWPDMVRLKTNPMNPAYHRPFWHYTDIPFFADGDDKPYAFKAVGPTTVGQPYDAISAWKWNLARLNDPAVSDAERAIALCWILHIGGDVHQPLHCVSLFSATYPNGDKGGNLVFFDTGHDRPDNLHFIWDQFLGDSLPYAQVIEQADKVTTDHPKTEFAAELKKTTVDDWLTEGQHLAIKYVYLDGKLAGASKAAGDPGKPTPPLPDGYRKAGIELSQKQAALAGYRIGESLAALALPPHDASAPGAASDPGTATGPGAATAPAMTSPPPNAPATQP